MLSGVISDEMDKLARQVKKKMFWESEYRLRLKRQIVLGVHKGHGSFPTLRDETCYYN